jgi:hypothetical protein
MEQKTTMTIEALPSTDRLNRQIASTQEQLAILESKVQEMLATHDNNPCQLAPAKSNIQSVYEILQAASREQAQRSKRINAQIMVYISPKYL